MFVDYPNALIAPVAGWDTTNMWVSSVNYFKDAANGNFSLTANFPYKGTDNNYLGAKNWWPEGGSAVHSLSDPGMKISVQKGTIQLVSAKTMHAAELYTSKGTRIIVENIHSNMATIDTKTLAKGVYILKVNMESNILTRKISITN